MKRLLFFLLLATPLFGQGQDSIRAVGGVLTVNLVPSATRYKVFVDQAITSTVITNPIPAAVITVLFVQDSTGHSVAFGGNISGGCAATGGVASTASSTTACQFTFDSANNVWTGIGGGSGGVPGQFNVKTYGAVGDAKKSINVITGSNTTLTDSTTSPWLASDVGKKIFCVNTVGGLSTLTTTISTITGFTSSSSITVSSNGLGASTSRCVWFTQKETTAMQAAGTAAIASAASVGSISAFALAYPSYVYCPPGGYVVDGPFFVQNASTANTNAASFIGAGRSSCIIYQSPDTVASNLVMMLNSTQTWGPSFTDFTVDCSGFAFNLVANGMRLANVARLTLSRITLLNCTNTGDVGGLISIVNGNGLTSDDLYIASSGYVTSEPPINISNNSGVLFRNLTTTNPGSVPISISGGQGAGGPRANTGGGITFESCTLDEGGNPGIVSLSAASVNMIACSIFEGTATGISVDANSNLYLTDTNIAPFGSACSAGTRNAISITGTGAVYSTGNTLAGCGTDNTGLSSAVNGASTSTFVDVGGNVLSNCNGVTPCPTVTPANYIRAYGGGVVPKATVTHTPNTCYANTGNLLATAQNICTLLLDQNYQAVNIAAQSGGTTPASSSCATPPVITLSDGTRSETMTMTSGQTVWCSITSGSCTASTVTNPNQIFANGTLLTISIGANTCVTPPSNVSVNYVLQSALNP